MRSFLFGFEVELFIIFIYHNTGVNYGDKLEDKIFELKSEANEFKLDRSIKFEDYYQCAFSLKINMYSNEKSKKVLNFSKNNKCCFCGASNKRVNFSQDTHVIPSAFGNSRLFTEEECNSCNQKFGQLYENELARLFQIDRTMQGIYNDKKIPKYKANINNGSEIRHLDTNNILFINKEDQLFKSVFQNLLDSEKDNIDIALPPIKINPLNVAKSLVHSAWLILDERQRKRNSFLLDWFLDKIQIYPLKLFIGTIEDKVSNILRFYIWENKKRDGVFSDLILVMSFKNRIILFGLPDSKSKKYTRCLLPPIALDAVNDQMTISMKEYPILSKDNSIEVSQFINVSKTNTTKITELNKEGIRDVNSFIEIIKKHKKMDD